MNVAVDMGLAGCAYGLMPLAIGGAIFASICFSKKKAARTAWIRSD
jgi:hypothetical protein